MKLQVYVSGRVQKLYGLKPREVTHDSKLDLGKNWINVWRCEHVISDQQGAHLCLFTNAATYYTILVTASASEKFENMVGNFQQVLLGDLEGVGCVIPDAVTLDTYLLKGNPRTLVGVMNQQVYEVGFMLEGEDPSLLDMQIRCNAMLRGQPSYVVPAQEFTKKTIAESPFVNAENMKGMDPAI